MRVRKRLPDVVVEGAKWWDAEVARLEAACGIIKVAEDAEPEKSKLAFGRCAWHGAETWTQRLQFIMRSRKSRAKLLVEGFPPKAPCDSIDSSLLTVEITKNLLHLVILPNRGSHFQLSRYDQQTT